MTTKFTRENGVLELVLTPENDNERVMTNELCSRFKVRYQKLPKFTIKPIGKFNDYKGISISKTHFISRRYLLQHGFIQHGNYFRKPIGMKVGVLRNFLIVVGTGIMVGYRATLSKDESEVNFAKISARGNLCFWLEKNYFREGEQPSYFISGENRAIIKTVDDLEVFLVGHY
jgi:hypothetical protein